MTVKILKTGQYHYSNKQGKTPIFLLCGGVICHKQENPLHSLWIFVIELRGKKWYSVYVLVYPFETVDRSFDHGGIVNAAQL